MKYIAVLDTDDYEDFAFFEDGKEQYLHAIDAMADNGEWIYLPFKPLEQEPVLDKIRAEIKALTSNRGFLSCSISYIRKEIDAVFDKYKAESEDT